MVNICKKRVKYICTPAMVGRVYLVDAFLVSSVVVDVVLGDSDDDVACGADFCGGGGDFIESTESLTAPLQ